MNRLSHEDRKALIEQAVRSGIWIDSDSDDHWISAEEDYRSWSAESSEEPDTIEVDESDEDQRQGSKFIDDEAKAVGRNLRK